MSWSNAYEILVFCTCKNKTESGGPVVSRASWTSKGAEFSS